MGDDLVLAIDQGTSATKVLAVDLSGHVVSRWEREMPVGYPSPERVESDPDAWWRSLASGVRRVTREVGAERVRSVGICGFMHTLVPVDERGRALAPAMLWPDQRAFAEVEELSPHWDTIRRVTGRELTTLSSLPRLLWLRKHAPEVLDKAHAFLCTKDALRFRLTGDISTDLYDADGTGLVDASTGRWSDDLLGLVGLSADRMPPIRRPDEVAGLLTPSAARTTGLAPGTPVVVGTGDWYATMLGSGCYLPERTCFYLGTAGILGSFESADELDRLGRTCYFGSVTSTGSALRWVRDLLFAARRRPPSYAEMCAEAEASEPGSRGLLFVPHMMGERGGRMRPHARGAFHGLTLAHRRADVVRAVMEGTAMWLRATTDLYTCGREIGDLVVHGGGGRSRLWRQICAAVFEQRLLVPEVTEGGALGAAMLTTVGARLAGGYRVLGGEWTRIVEVEEPDPALVGLYQGIYARFRRLEDALSSLDTPRHA